MAVLLPVRVDLMGEEAALALQGLALHRLGDARLEVEPLAMGVGY